MNDISQLEHRKPGDPLPAVEWNVILDTLKANQPIEGRVSTSIQDFGRVEEIVRQYKAENLIFAVNQDPKEKGTDWRQCVELFQRGVDQPPMLSFRKPETSNISRIGITAVPIPFGHIGPVYIYGQCPIEVDLDSFPEYCPALIEGIRLSAKHGAWKAIYNDAGIFLVRGVFEVDERGASADNLALVEVTRERANCVASFSDIWNVQGPVYGLKFGGGFSISYEPGMYGVVKVEVEVE
ncbi:hypothetical protein ES703_92917 [subsurface metagenome]